MYRIDDKAAAIKSVQRYLSKIFKGKMTVSENGILDKNTLLALNKFQEDNRLEIKNYVGYDDFTALYDTYLDKIERDNVRENNKTGIIYPLSRGDKNHEMQNINKMLLDITKYYGYFIPIEINDYFSCDTEKALKVINEIFETEDVNYIDEIMHSRIRKEWKSIQSNVYFP